MNQLSPFDVMLEAIIESSATHEEKIDILEKIKEYVNYHTKNISELLK